MAHKCLAAKKMLEKSDFDIKVEQTRGRNTPSAEEIMTTLITATAKR